MNAVKPKSNRTLKRVSRLALLFSVLLPSG